MFKIEDLHFKYPTNKEETIKGISFEIKDGEIFGFLGPSGAGKSTTQKLLIKLLKGFDGRVEYAGRNIEEYADEFYEEIGVGFEMPVHFSKLTAYENLEFFTRLYKKQADIDALLKRVGLYEYKDKKVAEYSKGMKMRLNFIRALVNDPKVLFIDEGTNGLDPMNAHILKDMMREFRDNGGTIFFTTHLMTDAEELCDRVAFIADGEIKEIAAPRDLKIKYGKRILIVEYKEKGKIKKEEFDMNHLKDNEAFINLIKKKDIETIHSGETTLDEIFIKVTGVKLDEK